MPASSLSVSAMKALKPSAVFSVAHASWFISKRKSASDIAPPKSSSSAHSFAQSSGFSFLSKAYSPLASCSSSPGGMVMRSTPAKASISSRS
eukprot:Skav232556  [mRNA]  locus=scaffold3309:49641:60929:+ [translate_table: standard]